MKDWNTCQCRVIELCSYDIRKMMFENPTLKEEERDGEQLLPPIDSWARG